MNSVQLSMIDAAEQHASKHFKSACCVAILSHYSEALILLRCRTTLLVRYCAETQRYVVIDEFDASTFFANARKHKRNARYTFNMIDNKHIRKQRNALARKKH